MEYEKRWNSTLLVPLRQTAFQNKISNESPVGHALIGKRVGDVEQKYVETQVGIIQYKVLAIQRV